MLIKTHRQVLKNFKPRIINGVSTRTNFAKNKAFFAPFGCVGFARCCGKMKRRHFFPYGGQGHRPVTYK